MPQWRIRRNICMSHIMVSWWSTKRRKLQFNSVVFMITLIQFTTLSFKSFRQNRQIWARVLNLEILTSIDSVFGYSCKNICSLLNRASCVFLWQWRKNNPKEHSNKNVDCYLIFTQKAWNIFVWFRASSFCQIRFSWFHFQYGNIVEVPFSFTHGIPFTDAD